MWQIWHDLCAVTQSLSHWLQSLLLHVVHAQGCVRCHVKCACKLHATSVACTGVQRLSHITCMQCPCHVWCTHRGAKAVVLRAAMKQILLLYFTLWPSAFSLGSSLCSSSILPEDCMSWSSSLLASPAACLFSPKSSSSPLHRNCKPAHTLRVLCQECYTFETCACNWRRRDVDTLQIVAVLQTIALLKMTALPLPDCLVLQMTALLLSDSNTYNTSQGKVRRQQERAASGSDTRHMVYNTSQPGFVHSLGDSTLCAAPWPGSADLAGSWRCIQ